MHEVWPASGVLLTSRYRLVTLLETGGMAQVWRATDELLDRPVAVKLPAGDTRAAHLAWREARLAARLSHPGIAAVHDYREAVRPDGSVAPFVVMELLGGETVAARLHDGGPMPWGEAVSIAAAVAEALAAAHAAGVVHRDIKPGNVMLCPGGVKLLDFGIGAAAGEPDDDATGVSFGTPAYAAPERLDGKPAEPATDLYGLGVLLFEMVTGNPPYDVHTWDELAAAQANGPTPLPGTLPARLRELIIRCLDDDPHRRPSAAQARRVLTRLVPSAPSRLTIPLPQPPPTGHAKVPPAPAPEPSPPTRRVAIGVALAATAVAFIAVINAVGSPDGEPGFAQGPTGSPSATPSPTRPTEATRTTAPPAPPSTAPTSTTATTATTAAVTVDAALGRVRTAVEQGRQRGEIRADVATDFLNLLQLIDPEADTDLTDQVDELIRKVRQRREEEGLTEGRATVLRERLTDLRALT